MKTKNEKETKSFNKRIKEAYGVETDSKLAKSIPLSTSTVSYLNKNGWDHKYAYEAEVKTGFSAKWIITGRGPKTKAGVEVKIDKKGNFGEITEGHYQPLSSRNITSDVSDALLGITDQLAAHYEESVAKGDMTVAQAIKKLTRLVKSELKK